jgi:hypothetical protein
VSALLEPWPLGLPVAAVTEDERTDVANQGTNQNGDREDDDQRRPEAGEEHFDADLLRVLQADDEDEGDENADDPGAPVDRLSLRGHPLILERAETAQEGGASETGWKISADGIPITSPRKRLRVP